jgi:hypothetical protein
LKEGGGGRDEKRKREMGRRIQILEKDRERLPRARIVYLRCVVNLTPGRHNL